jgi:hypothetical protein
MVPVNDSKMEEILTFFTSNDPNHGAAFKFCAVYGHRQAGKSTRLNHIKTILGSSNLLVVPIDMRAVSKVPNDFYCSLAKRIDRSLRNHVPPYKVFPTKLTCEGFQELFESEGSFEIRLRETNKTGLLLLIEEMDALRCIEEFWCGISTMLETNQDVLKALASTATQDQRSTSSQMTTQFPYVLRGVIGVGVHRIVRDSNPGSTSSPPNKKRDILVPHFSEEQVDMHLWKPVERDYNFRFTADAKELLFDFIRGHPGLTCRAGTKILALITSKQTSSIPFSFTRSHAISILHRMILNSRHESPLNDMVMALEHQFSPEKL